MQINLSPFPVLTTDRLILRALDISDNEALLQLRSDDRVNRYLDRSSAITIDDADAFIHKINKLIQDNTSFYWAITLKGSPTLIGTICYWNLDHEKDMAEIGYELLPDYQGQGIMQEALVEVLRYGFEVVQMKIIAALTHPDNESSTKLLIRNGFKLDEYYKLISKDDADGLAVYILRAPISFP